MSDQLTNSDRVEIKYALRDVADTFHKTIVSYKAATTSLDRWQEDRPNTPIVYNIPCGVEYGIKENDRFVTSTAGELDKATVKLTINTNDLTDLGAWDAVNNVAPFDGGADEFELSGRTYMITTIAYDGYFDQVPQLCYILGDPKPKKA